MKLQKFGILTCVLFLQSQLVLAFEFRHPEAREISALIDLSLSAQKLEDIVFSYPVLIKYQHLARHEVPIQELLELQYRIQHWRKQAAQLSFSLIEQREKFSSEEYDELLSIFLNLDYRLSVSELDQIFKKNPLGESQKSVREKLLIAFQAHYDCAMPPRVLPIFPLKKITFEF